MLVSDFGLVETCRLTSVLGNDAHYTLLLLLKLVHDNCDI